MNDQNRVLVRRGARNLNEKEIEQVSGGLRTDTVCTFGPNGNDGDTFLHEC
ncbi:MAG: hypothetical protein LAO78_13580 [Acidobacteriia bacterium]|nr:hypothetical protein [Terriglobia bacterium]